MLLIMMMVVVAVVVVVEGQGLRVEGQDEVTVEGEG